MDQRRRIKFKYLPPPTFEWTKSAIKGIVSTFPDGLTVSEVVTKFYQIFGIDLPVYSFPCHRLMLEAMPDIVIFYGDLICDASKAAIGKRKEEGVSKDWTKSALKDILSSIPGGVTIVELKNKFQELFGIQLPQFDYPTHRLMLETFNDVLALDGDKIYKADQIPDHCKVKGQVITSLHLETTKMVVKDLLSSMSGGITVAELMEKIYELIGTELPRFHFTTHRYMLEAMQDVLVFDGDYIYEVGEVAASLPVPPEPSPSK